MKAKRSDDMEARKLRRDRYWSVMLVGEHGRIIPLKGFKTIAISALCVMAIAVAAAIIFGIAAKRRSIEIDRLQVQLQEFHDLAAKLRDEKDLYLTQFIASQKSDATLRKEPDAESQAATPPRKETKENEKTAPVPVSPELVPAPSPAPAPPVAAVHWKVDIRNLSVRYDPEHEVLKTEFRIYNTSTPKKPLTGRIVVVFKQMDAPSLNWFTVPRVQISGGKPDAEHGQAFKINNYRTMTFRAYQQKAPVNFDTLSVFVFSGEGKLISERDFPFHIDYKPPEKSTNAIKPAGESRSISRPSQVENPPAAQPAPVAPASDNGASMMPEAEESLPAASDERSNTGNEAPPKLPSEVDTKPNIEGDQQ